MLRLGGCDLVNNIVSAVCGVCRPRPPEEMQTHPREQAEFLQVDSEVHQPGISWHDG
jgi:hypothetical protein